MKSEFTSTYILVFEPLLYECMYLYLSSDARVEQKTFKLSDDHETEVTMTGYPDSCCHGFIATLRYVGSAAQKIRMQFSDLHVPPHSIIKVNIVPLSIQAWCSSYTHLCNHIYS